MRTVVISDVHGNLEALLAVLHTGYDRLIFLGDFVDYGPSPSEVIRLIKEQADVVLKGNHDHAFAYKTDCGCSENMKKISEDCRELFTGKKVNESQAEYLRSLSHSKSTFIEDFHFFAAHGAPEDMNKYVTEDLFDDELRAIFGGIKENIIFVGHTHKPYIKELDGKLIINAGSVGQPRDGDPRASFIVLEDNEPRIERVEYDIETTIAKINSEMNDVPADERDKLIRVLKTGKI